MKHTKLLPILIFFGLLISFSAKADTSTRGCETNTMKDGVFCNWTEGRSWCNGNTLVCEVESTADCPVNPTGGTYAFSCSYNYCVLSCNTGYTKCSTTTCKLNVTVPDNCTTFNQCTEVCSACAQGYELIGGVCVGATLKLGSSSVGVSNYIFQSSNPALVIPDTGYVGIGTTTPGAKLDVSDLIKMRTSTITQDEDVINKGYLDSAIGSAIAGGSGETVGYWGLDGSNLYASSTDWKVGIGTTDPTTPIEIAGGTNGAGIETIATIRHKGTTNSDGARLAFDVTSADAATPMAEIDAIRYVNGASGDLAFRTRISSATTEKMRITSGGNVGIGTTVPNTQTEIQRYETVNRTTYNDILTISAKANTLPYVGHGGGILFRGSNYQNNDANINYARIGSTINSNSVNTFGSDLFFDVAPTSDGTLARAMTIRYNGNVGIGTTAPAKLLQVARDGDSSVSAPYLRIENTHTTIDTANDYGGIEFYANDISAGGVGVSGFIKSVAINAGVTSALTFGSRNTGNATEMMRINNLGYVGIGTTAPNDILSITDSGVAAPAGSSGTGHNHADTYLSTDDYALTNYGVVKTLIAGGSGSTVGYWGLSGSNLYASSTAWNVGIGTTAPTLGKLQIDFTGEDVDLFAINYTSSGVRFKVYNQDWGGTLSLYDGANNHNIKLAATANAVSYIANGGNVGIGTTNPSQRLEVNGIIKSTGMITTWKSARLDPTNSKWHKIGTLTLTGQYHTYQGTFMTHMRGITNDNDVTSIYKFTARQPAMTSSPIVDIHHLGSVSNNGTSFDVKAIITADTESSKTIDLYVGNVNSSYLYYSHSILNQSIEVGGSFSIVEGDTGVLVGSLPAGTQIDMIKGLTTLNSGYVGIGTVSPPSLLSLDDGGGITGSPKIEFNSRSYVGYYSGTLALQGRSGKGISFNVNNDTFGSGTAMLLDISGRLGIGTTAPNDIFSITNSGVAAPAGSSGTGHNYADTYLSEDDYALANYGLVKTLIAGTSGTYETGGYLPLAGGDMQGYIDMSGYSIDQVGTLTVEKLNATTIDPLYFLNGINYATFVSSVVGGVKEEYVGKIKINRKVAVPTAAEVKTEFEAVIDFAKTEEGGELWVWRQIVDFSKDSVDVLITPYGEFASVYYLIQDNKLIFRSDRPAEISYRLIGKRFDWRKWPLKVKDQTRQGVKVK